MEREALKMALEALESGEKMQYGRVGWIEYDSFLVKEAITAIKAALAQPAQKHPWVGLTDEEIKEIVGPYGDTPIKGYTRKLFDQIEAKLKEKNNG